MLFFHLNQTGLGIGLPSRLKRFGDCLRLESSRCLFRTIQWNRQSLSLSLKNHKSKILSSGWVVDIRKWFRRWGVDDLLELSSDAMHYVMIAEGWWNHEG